MIKGVDYAWGRPDPTELATAGYAFACRYLSYGTTGKNLTLAEANGLTGAGLSIVSNWEYAPGAALNGLSQGQRDAVIAQTQHVQCGGPVDRPIYFSVDFAPTPDQLAGPISDYFRGVANVLGHARVGAYGGIATIGYLFDHQLISWGWQTYAWSGNRWDPRGQIQQVANGLTFRGADIDMDYAVTTDYGQWPTELAGPHGPGQLAVDGQLGPLTISRWQTIMGTPVDGTITQPPGRSDLVAAVQRHLNSAIGAGLVVDGIGICQDGHTHYLTTAALQRYLGTVEDGYLSLPVSQCVRELQVRLNGGRF